MRLAAVLLLAATVTLATPAAAATVACPQVISHRAQMLDAPENTLPGITAAAASGADGVELDVQWSSSAFPVLMHDATVDRTTNGTGTPASLGLGQLTSLLAQDFAPWKTDPRFATTRVPYGYEFMGASAAADLDVVLDVHAAPTDLGVEKLRIYVADYHGWTARTLVMGTVAQVTAMRAWEPGLRYAVIEYPPAGRVYTGDYLVSLGVVAYVLPYYRVTGPLVDYMHASGLLVYSWSSDSTSVDVPATWTALAAAGVDGLITNEPAAAIAALGCAAPSPSLPTPTLPASPTQSPDPTPEDS